MFISLIFNIIAFSGCIEEQENIEKIDDLILRIGFGPDIYDIQYPFIGYHTDQMLSINSNIYNTLVEYDEGFEIVPSLAETWYNPDNLTWRFLLRKDVKFHNGYNFSAEDVKYTIEKIKEDENNSVYLHFSIVKEINLINNFSIDIITEKPDPLFLNYLTYVFIISKQYYTETTDKYPLGTGPYKYSRYVKNQSIILKRFNGYWGETPRYKNVTFIFYNNYEDKLYSLYLGFVDMIDNVYQKDAELLSDEDGIKSMDFFAQQVYYLSFDFRKNNSCCFYEENPVSDLRVRKAMYHAINMDNIIENVSSSSIESASQYISSNVIGYNPNINRLSYNLDLAQQYMKDAGYQNGFEIELDCRDSAQITNISLMISNQLSEINITVNVNNLPRSEFQQKIFVNRNSSFYLVGWQVDSGDAGEIFNGILRSVDEKNGFGDFNYGYYSNNEIDNISEKINSEMNPRKRITLMHEGFEIAMNDVACIPMFEIKFTYLMKDTVSWRPSVNKIIKLEDIEIV
jgi:peptide/nickel transport system substrate-binding protein